VPAALADKELATVTPAELSAWLRAMVKMPRRARTSDEAATRIFWVDLKDQEVMQRRQSSANRVLDQLRSIRNRFRARQVQSD
jgi:hypothetical protein